MDYINLTIGAVIGVFTSFLSAFFYEIFTNKRNSDKERNNCLNFISNNDKYDWETYDIQNGQIQEKRLAVNKMKYVKNSTIQFEWYDLPKDENINAGTVTGYGNILWSSTKQGKMWFYEYKNNWFGYRDVAYTITTINKVVFDAIFVNADDQGTRYVMLRKRELNRYKVTHSVKLFFKQWEIKRTA